MSTNELSRADVDSWYRAYADRLRVAVRRIVGNGADADDAIQEAFIAAYRSLARYDCSDPYPWLHRIATRKALTIASVRRPTCGLVDAWLPAPSAEDVALDRMTSRDIREAVGCEPAVAAHLIGGLRFREIAERFGLPAATAATRVRRGKRRLRMRLQATLSDLPESKPA